MVFSSGVFLILFLPLTLLIYYNPFFKSRKIRNLLLLMVSVFFYAWGEPWFVLIMLLSIIINCGLALMFDQNNNAIIRKIVFIGLIALDLGILFIFKYLNFTVENLNYIFSAHIPVPGIALPIGISFYTFQIISYVIDVYRGKVRASRNFFDIALYISMFPQLIAGPIVRYSTVYNEIEHRKENWTDFTYGIRRFVIGLGKKVMLADLLAGIADEMFFLTNVTDGLTVLSAWIGAVAYTFQIYFDFSGYSDMAIGLGRCFGFHFEENFNYPYIASSVSDFWKRWHISLTNWFRDYVYIPLGGNRCSARRHIFHLFVVWLLTGIWHGANWTFILWGMIYFVIQFIEKRFSGGNKTSVFGRIYTLPVIIICWVIFRSDSVTDAFVYIEKMAGVGAELYDSLALQTIQGSWLIFVISILACVPWKNFLLSKIGSKKEILVPIASVLGQVAVVLLFFISLLSVINGNYSPFVYFNF